MQRRRNSPCHSRGFTLIELLIVITVIAVLIGLLVPAVTSVQRRVRDTAVQAEVNRLATAVTAFKTDFGMDPPSFIILCERATGPGSWADTSNPRIVRSRALIRQLWPQFDFTYSGHASNQLDLNQDGTAGNGPWTLHGGECLVLFLGGLPQRSTSGGTSTFTLLPFSKNPQDPFSFNSNANREKSAYDFPADRLVDRDNDGFPEFLDSYPGQTEPIIYFSSYDGTGYRTDDYPGNPPTSGSVDKSLPISWYIQGGVPSSSPAVPTGPPYNSKTFQIISPGRDTRYGPGGPYDPGNAVPLPAWDRTGNLAVSVSVADRADERDNITNFGNGLLVP